MFNLKIVLLVILGIIGFFYYAYASVIKKKNKVNEAFASIDVQLKSVTI